MTRLAALWLLLPIFFAASPAFGHKPSDSYLRVTASGETLAGQWDIALRDLEYAMGLDANGDGAITWGELRQKEVDVSTYALARLSFATGEANKCALKPGAIAIDQHTDGGYVVIPFTGTCPGSTDTVTVDYRLFFDLDPQHRGLATVTANGIAQTAIFSPDASRQTIDAGSGGGVRQFFAFAVEGVWHIWIGVDHILFLLALLLPSMVVRTDRGWQPVARVSDAFWNVFAIVTAFTIAHSITLTLAALEVATLPSRWVETAIAASVLFAAVNNLYPMVRRRLWLLAFVFGLVHGFGFASVLLELGLPRNALVLSLLGFNLGVELGQIVIVAIFFGISLLLFRKRLYGRVVVAGGSALIALIALGWMIERGLDLKLFPS